MQSGTLTYYLSRDGEDIPVVLDYTLASDGQLDTLYVWNNAGAEVPLTETERADAETWIYEHHEPDDVDSDSWSDD